MRIRVYNQNGKVKVTKICHYRELTMFSAVPEGEVVEIEVGVSQYSKAVKKKAEDLWTPVDADTDPYKSTLPSTDITSFEKAIRVLKFAAAGQLIDQLEMGEAVLQLARS